VLRHPRRRALRDAMTECNAPDIEWPTDDRHEANGTVMYHGIEHKCGLGPGHANRHRCRCGVRSINPNSQERPDSGRPLTV